ncbi:M1 family metallopeptidase [Nocardia sp. CDC159]|uniref:Aminopeptidase N n=1 Tax=Nocardia pulmonis TaxID=2951408 RepID=A0A9X2IXN0_9NOCA|nr:MULTISPECIES: M1 family metallopeptidase [Nocardia]MCM6773021.1 M1 family metallopeptidase [Nocardia pulmonis]MCM6785676.1 M1 family metallopeptidase [Nocardia sp. CDC159]
MRTRNGVRWSAALVLAASVFATSAQAQPPADPFVGASGLGDPYYPEDGNGGYQVDHYDIAISYDPPSHQLTGTARLNATATQALRMFDLDFEGPQVRRVLVNNLPAGFVRHGEHKVSVTPTLPLLPGLPFTVTVEYGGEAVAHEDGGWTFSPSGGAFAAGEPHSAATWYPLNDTPSDKATFALRVTVPQEWEVVSNGLRTRDDVDGPNRTVEWVSRHPTLGYLTTVAIDRFEFLDSSRANGTPLISAFAPGATRARELEQRLPEVLDFIESVYGPYPFESGGGIYVDTELNFSLETQTRPIYAPWTDLATVVHENAHQWWGDSMSVKQWSDICLNECFASYTADYLWPERKEGVDVDARYRKTVAERLADARFWEIPLQNPGAGREFTAVYYRGPLFLHALRRLIGDEVFFSATRDFVQSHAYGNASMPEFRQFVQSRTGVDLAGFFAAWLDHDTAPGPEYLYPGSLGG